MVEVERTLHPGERVASVIPGEGQARAMTRILAAIGFVAREDKRGKARVLAELSRGELVTGNRIEETLAWRPGDIRARKIRDAAAVRVGCTEIGEVGDHGDLLLVSLQRRQAFGESDLGEPPRLVRIERFLRETKSASEENQSFRRRCGCRGRFREGFEERQCQERAARSEKGATGK